VPLGESRGHELPFYIFSVTDQLDVQFMLQALDSVCLFDRKSCVGCSVCQCNQLTCNCQVTELFWSPTPEMKARRLKRSTVQLDVQEDFESEK